MAYPRDPKRPVRPHDPEAGVCQVFINPHPEPTFGHTGRWETFWHFSTQEANHWDAIRQLDPFQKVSPEQ